MEGLLSAAGGLRRTAVLLQGRGERRKNKEKVKFMEKYGLWSGMNSAIVHIVH